MGFVRKEGDLVKACLAYLHLKKIPAWRMNTGALKVGDRFIRFGHPGMSDIIGIWRGWFLAVECKMPGSKPTDLQADFLSTVQFAGGIAFVVHSLDELQQKIKKSEESVDA